MPIVPAVEQNPTGMPTVQAPAAAPMHNYEPQQQEQLGATTQAAGEASMRANQAIALHIQSQMDDANVKAAESKFIQSATDTLHGDKGYMNLRGADAINGYDPASESLVKAKKDILDSLSNDVQKVQFNRISQQHLVTLGAQMSQHRAQQRVEYTAAQSMARADSMRSMAQNSDIGSADQNKYIETGVQETQNALAAKGIPVGSEQSLEAERKFRSQITADNVSRKMEDGDYVGASAILTDAQSKNQVEGDTADRLRRAIRGNLQLTDDIKAAKGIFAPYQGRELRGTDLEAMYSEVNKIQDDKKRERVEGMVFTQYNKVHSMQAQEYRDILNDAVNYKAQHGSLNGLDPNIMGKLQPSDYQDLTRPPAAKSDLDTILGFLSNPDSLTVDNVKHAQAIGKLSDGDTRSLAEKAATLQNKPDYIQEASDVNGRIEYFANQAGIPVFKTSKSPDEMASEAQLKMAVNNEIDRVKGQQHGKLTSDDVDKIIKKELTKQTLQQLRSPFNPAAWFGNKFSTSEIYTFQKPEGATQKVPGSDGHSYWFDNNGKNFGRAD